MSSRPTLLRQPETLLGHVEPRLATPPLRDLSAPGASYGPEVIAFARDVLGKPLEPWQEAAVIRAGELQADNLTPRFRKVLLIVSRQSGKTYLLAALSAFWLFAEQWPLVLGLHSTLNMARESWDLAQSMALDSPFLEAEFGKAISGNNNPHWLTTGGTKYKIAAATRKGGRGLSVDRLIFDELREQQNWIAYLAALPSMTARPQAQAWLISNQGDDTSVVLNTLRDEALQGIKGEPADPELGLIEWSAPEGAAADDPEAIAAACPRLGRGGRSLTSYLAEARQSMRAADPAALMGWQTEYLCQRVSSMNPAINTAAYADCLTALPEGFADLRGKVALCFDLAKSERHATLYAAAVQPDGRTRIGFVREWAGVGCADAAGRELPALVKSIKPRAFGWLPGGPAAAVGAALATERPREWPPPGVTVEEIRGELTQVCMGFSALVDARQLARSAAPLLDGQVGTAEKLPRGDAWVITRKGADADAIYAAAGAAHLARSLPAGKGEIRVLLPNLRSVK